MWRGSHERAVYHWIDHTGELELEVRARDEAEIFEHALAAVHELLDDGNRDFGEVSHQLELSGTDRATLLADYLAELFFLGETQGFVPDRLERLELRDRELSATVRGRRGRPPHLVKAVTYHELAFDRSAEGWRACMVLDV